VSVSVAVVDALADSLLEVVPVDDQRPIEILPTDSADEAVGEGLARRASIGVRMTRTFFVQNAPSKLSVNLVAPSRIRNLTG
jgi:hypothetical protein